MAIGIFGGSFDPVHSQHVEYAKSAIEFLGLKKLFILPSYVAPHKLSGARASAEERLKLCQIAFSPLPQAEVSDYEITARGTSYTYLTCRHFKEIFPNEKLYLLVGADMLEDFFTWKNPEDILQNATLVACERGNIGVKSLEKKFFERFHTNFLTAPFAGETVSSTQIRTDLAFEKQVEIPSSALAYIQEKGLYFYPVIGRALSLLKPSRQEHTYRVAVMATARARSAGVSEEKALLAAALHDCAKYLQSDSSLLNGFTPPKGVPEPVLHQFSGAFVAERAFQIDDEEILNAIRYHTSGKEKMTSLEKLIFLADMLEEGRDFPQVGALRNLFWKDLDECLYQALAHQVEYLKQTNKPIYDLTERAYEYEKQRKGE